MAIKPNGKGQLGKIWTMLELLTCFFSKVTNIVSIVICIA